MNGVVVQCDVHQDHVWREKAIQPLTLSFHWSSPAIISSIKQQQQMFFLNTSPCLSSFKTTSRSMGSRFDYQNLVECRMFKYPFPMWPQSKSRARNSFGQTNGDQWPPSCLFGLLVARMTTQWFSRQRLVAGVPTPEYGWPSGRIRGYYYNQFTHKHKSTICWFKIKTEIKTS